MWCVIIAVCHQGNISACENPFLNIYSSNDVLTKTRCVADGWIQIRTFHFLMKDLFVIRSCSLWPYSVLLLMLQIMKHEHCTYEPVTYWETETLQFTLKQTHNNETETAVVNDIIQTLCFVYCVLQRHCLSFTANWHTTTLTFSQTCQCCLNWKWPVMTIFTVHNLHYFQMIFKWYFILYPSLKVHSVLFW